MMNNSVTLEQLNAPTDLESLSPLQGFRCAKSDLTYVTLAWHGPNGTQDGFVYGAASNEWLERNIEELTLGRKASRSETHEDEELMIRVKLDEGV